MVVINKQLFQFCSIDKWFTISISTLFSDKTNQYKLYDLYKIILNKMNDQTYLKKSTTITIKIWREYMILIYSLSIMYTLTNRSNNVHVHGSYVLLTYLKDKQRRS
jgi:hypothetical protein